MKSLCFRKGTAAQRSSDQGSSYIYLSMYILSIEFVLVPSYPFLSHYKSNLKFDCSSRQQQTFCLINSCFLKAFLHGLISYGIKIFVQQGNRSLKQPQATNYVVFVSSQSLVPICEVGMLTLTLQANGNSFRDWCICSPYYNIWLTCFQLTSSSALQGGSCHTLS